MAYEKIKNLESFDQLLIKDDYLVTIYHDTHKRLPDNKSDALVLKNLLARADKELKEHTTASLSDRLRDLIDDSYFWAHTNEGLAVFVGKDDIKIYEMYESPKTLYTIDDHFYLLPLLENRRYIDKPVLIDLARDKFRVFKYLSKRVEEYDLPEDVHKNFKDLYDDLDNDSSLGITTKASGDAFFYGQNTSAEGREKDRERFFRYINDALLKEFGKEKPIIIIGLNENINTFKNLNKNLNIVKMVSKPFNDLTEEDLINTVDRYVEAEIVEREKVLIRSYQANKNKNLASNNIKDIEKASREGRINMLIVNDLINEKLESQYFNRDDFHLINTAIVETLKAGGDVVTSKNEDLMEEDMVRAILRF